MNDLIASCQAAARRPVLERLRFYESLPRLTLAETIRLVPALERDENSEWASEVLSLVAPVEFWIDAAHESPSFLVGRVEHMIGRPLVDGLLAALARSPEQRYLEQLHGLTVRDPLPADAVDACAAHAADSRPHVRAIAAVIAVEHRSITPAVTRALGELLAGTITVDPASFDVRGVRADVAFGVAACGRALASLAPQIALLLADASLWPVAALAAGEVGDASLLPAIDEAARRLPTAESSRSLVHFARWRLTGKVRDLDEALGADDESILTQQLLRNAFRKPVPDERLLGGLVRAAARPAWRAIAYNVLGIHGAAAATALAQLSPPRALGDDSDDAFAAIEFYGARWRCGLATPAELVTALAPWLGDDRAWDTFVECDAVATPRWHETIRAAVADGETPPVLSALGQAPVVAARFLPELLRARRDGLVELLWRALPAEAFWSAVSS